jgi:hypothetical protein
MGGKPVRLWGVLYCIEPAPVVIQALKQYR